MKYAIRNRLNKYLFITEDNKVTWIDIKDIATLYDNLNEAIKVAKEFGGYSISKLKWHE
jgi:hypothetical protein